MKLSPLLDPTYINYTLPCEHIFEEKNPIDSVIRYMSRGLSETQFGRVVKGILLGFKYEEITIYAKAYIDYHIMDCAIDAIKRQIPLEYVRKIVNAKSLSEALYIHASHYNDKQDVK